MSTMFILACLALGLRLFLDYVSISLILGPSFLPSLPLFSKQIKKPVALKPVITVQL